MKPRIVIHNHYEKRTRDARKPFPNETSEVRKRILEIRRRLAESGKTLHVEARKLEEELHELMSKAMK